MSTESLVQLSRIEDIQFYDSGEVADAELDKCDSNDEVFILREWGTHRMVPLRVLAGRQNHTGPASTAALEISDRNIARGIGLELTREDRTWRLKDWAGTANLKQDGSPTREVTLLAGTEVTIAGRILIAESPRSVGLRAFLSRLLGWSDQRIAAVDRALRAIRLASSGRAMLLIRGIGDLVPIAATIHRHALGREEPFIVSDPWRRNRRETVRLPANCKVGMVALDKACGGTLCVRASRMPADFGDVLSTFQATDSGVRLLICVGNSAPKAFSATAAPIDIPPLGSRQDELIRIIREFADDAIEHLCAPKDCLRPQDLEWISRLPNLTFSEIDKTSYRVVAMKTSRNITTAARKLGMAPVSLTRWLARRVSKEAPLYVPQPNRSEQRYPEHTINAIEAALANETEHVRDAQEAF